MKQNRDINRVWQTDLPIWRRGLASALTWLFVLLGLILTCGLLLFARDLGIVWRVALWLNACLLSAGIVLAIMKRRDRQRSWRQDDSVVEPSPGRFISPLYEEREWSLPSHPFIRYPLGLILIAYFYWVLVVHQMKVPGFFLIGLVVLTLASLWCWREPLLLVLMLIVGVALLSVVGWIITLPLSAILGIVAALGLGSWLGLLAIQKKQSRGPRP